VVISGCAIPGRTGSQKVMLMFTFKNLAALGLFLFGTTFLWMTASFAGRVPPPSGDPSSVGMTKG
jgi:hypothetical protein